jgi:transposase
MLPASVRIFVCTEPQDMRRSFDGLALATTQILGKTRARALCSSS